MARGNGSPRSPNRLIGPAIAAAVMLALTLLAELALRTLAPLPDPYERFKRKATIKLRPKKCSPSRSTSPL